MSIAEAQMLEAQAKELLTAAVIARSKARRECVHPLQHLNILEGACRSLRNQEMFIICKLCGHSENRWLALQRD